MSSHKSSLIPVAENDKLKDISNFTTWYNQTVNNLINRDLDQFLDTESPEEFIKQTAANTETKLAHYQRVEREKKKRLGTIANNSQTEDDSVPSTNTDTTTLTTSIKPFPDKNMRLASTQIEASVANHLIPLCMKVPKTRPDILLRKLLREITTQSSTEADILLEKFKNTTISQNETLTQMYYRLTNQQAILELYGNTHKITDQELIHQFIQALPQHDNWATFKTQVQTQLDILPTLINRPTAPITPRQVLDMAKKHNLQMLKNEQNNDLNITAYNQTKTNGSSTKNNHNNKRKSHCLRCGNNHLGYPCKIPKTVICNYCGQPGHIAAACKQKQTQNNNNNKQNHKNNKNNYHRQNSNKQNNNYKSFLNNLQTLTQNINSSTQNNNNNTNQETDNYDSDQEDNDISQTERELINIFSNINNK